MTNRYANLDGTKKIKDTYDDINTGFDGIDGANYAADAGTTDAYAVTLDPAPTAYAAGMIVQFMANTSNTGACTLDVNSLGAKTIKKNVSDDLEDSDILEDQIISVIYDGTNFQMLSDGGQLKTHKSDSTPHDDATNFVKADGSIAMTGNLGIHATPQAELHVKAESTVSVVTDIVRIGAVFGGNAGGIGIGFYAVGDTSLFARIAQTLDGTGNGGALSFYTKPPAGSVTESLTLSSDGILNPGADNTQSLGSAALRWSEVFAGTGTINTSDENEKEQIEDLNTAEKAVATALRGLIKKFKFKSAVTEKGTNARIHVGVIAQDVQDAFTAEGLDASDYGVFCSDTWWEKEETRTPMIDNPDFDPKQPGGEDNPKQIEGEPYTETVIYQEAVEGGTEKTRLGVRYDELLAFIIAAL